MRRMFSIFTVAALAAVAVGAAAMLNLDGGAIQAGEDFDLTCADDAEVLGWGLESDTGMVSAVRIALTPDTCDGNEMFVNITDGDSVIAQGSVELPNLNQGGHQVNFPAVNAVDIEDIHVFIEGPTGSP